MSTALGARAAAVRETIAELTEAVVDPVELVGEVAERVRRVVPYDAGTWGVTDPETLIPGAVLTVDAVVDDAACRVKQRTELTQADFLRFDDLDRRRRTAASLAAETGGELSRSARHRDVFGPLGMGDELRLLARSGDATWGTGSLVRGADAPDFGHEEVRYVASIAQLLGDGLRAGLARTALAAAGGTPGMLVLDADWRVEASTAAADRWLARLPGAEDPGLPSAITMVAAQAWAAADTTGGPGTSPPSAVRPARVRLRLRDGGWLLVHGDVLAGAGEPRVAIVLEPAGRAELLPLLMALHGLTERERQVTTLLVAGLATDEIAQRLSISRHTLRDHTKAIFAKVGVGSRPELTAVLGAEV
jgi:DNA-binding CsgD family transcriptional regulator